MRFVDRTQFDPPAFTNTPQFEEVRRILADIHDPASGGKRLKQRIQSFDDLFAPFREEAIHALHTVFAGKCAYTERPLKSRREQLFHLHRPGGDAIGLESTTDPEHYWWLQTEWKNWMLVSPQVETCKGTNFPVVGKRMGLKAKWAERALLIDPCLEESAWWLDFRENGRVEPRYIPSAKLNDPYGGHDRGEINIRLLDLNSSQLISKRRGVIKQFGVDHLEDMPVREYTTRLVEMLEPSTPYLGVLRQRAARAFCRYVAANGVRTADENFAAMATSTLTNEIAAYLFAHGEVLELVRGIMKKREMAPVFQLMGDMCPDLIHLLKKPRIRGAKQKDEAVTMHTRVPSEAKPTRPQRPKAKKPKVRRIPRKKTTKKKAAKKKRVTKQVSQVIERAAPLKEIRIRNVKAITDLTIAIPQETVTISTGSFQFRQTRENAVNWKMLLGENACGKSSVLQAVALALYGPDIEKNPPVPVEVMRRRNIGNEHSFVQLSFRGYEGSVKLRLNKNGFKYEQPPEYRIFVRAYGATRLFDHGGAHSHSKALSDRCRVDNVFDPRAPIVDVETWLLDLNEGDFAVAARAIRSLIAGVGEKPVGVVAVVELHRDPQKKVVILGEDRLTELSDGYRALLALICDIMAGLGTGLSGMESATGIVLLDEIGAHLHPRLRMQVVSRLRYIFPRIQFLVSTHEPLCLRGLFANEVDRIHRIESVVYQETIERSPSGFRVDQLLTSDFFGLETTVDPEIDEQFQYYYHLLRKLKLTPAEAHERDQFRTQLMTEGVLGYTRRDQLVYDAIDEYLADKRMMPAKPRGKEALQRRRETLERIKQYWSMAELKQASRSRT